MVTKHTREFWPYEPQVMTDDEQENAYFRLLEQEDAPEPTSPLAWCVYGLYVLMVVLLAWHLLARFAILRSIAWNWLRAVLRRDWHAASMYRDMWHLCRKPTPF